MSDPTNQYPSIDQSPYGQAPQGAPQGTYGQAPYGQAPQGAPQGAYGQAYALNPALEKIRSNASTVRIFSFVSFIFGGLFLSGGMWIWANNMTAEAQNLGAPLDIATDLASARNTAKICTIIHAVVLALGLVFIIGSVVLAIMAGGSSYGVVYRVGSGWRHYRDPTRVCSRLLLGCFSY